MHFDISFTQLVLVLLIAYEVLDYFFTYFRDSLWEEYPYSNHKFKYSSCYCIYPPGQKRKMEVVKMSKGPHRIRAPAEKNKHHEL